MPSRGAYYTHHITTCPTEFSDFPMALHRVDDIKRLLDILWLGMMPYCRSWESMSSSSQLEILVWILALHYELDRTKNIHKFNFASHNHFEEQDKRYHVCGKGQLISKCPFDVIVWTKIPTKKFDKFCPRIWEVVKS
jgi:hypothetical protein